VECDAALSTIRSAFAQPVEQILGDGAIEPAFAALMPAVSDASPLDGAGAPWVDGAAIDIGPNVPAPACQEDFWAAFRALGLRDIDRFCQLPDESGHQD